MKFFILITFCAILATSSAARKAKVSVYYETLCGDSKRFITKQLHPFMKSGGQDAVSIKFIPYGKATTLQQGDRYTFKCQHGNAECEGNKMHSCAIKYLTKDQTMEFIGCSMTKRHPPTSLNSCAKAIGIDESTVNEIDACAKGAEGEQLLAEYGELTTALSPKLFFVPTITYDDVFDVEKMWGSQNNFKGIVCEHLDNEPEVCGAAERGENRGARRVR